MRTIRLFAAVVALAACASTPTLAGDDMIIPLKFIPTTKPGHVKAELRDGVSNRGIALAIEDSRAVKSKDIVGEGTGAGDDTFRIRSAGFMPTFLKSALTDRFSTWGVLFEDTSNLVLVVRVTRYYTHEQHQFMNSTFTGEVQLPWTLADRAGHVYAEGTAMGTSQTKGRWRNPVNCEEVLSDALEQAAAAILKDEKLQDAWLAAKPEAAPIGLASATPAAAPLAKVVMVVPGTKPTPQAASHAAAHAPSPKTPSQLLGEVNKLRRQQLGTDVLVAYVAKQSLATSFTADDLVAWKKAGVPEPVMKEAVKRAP